MDPAKLPAIRGADLDPDPGRQARPRPGPGRAPARRRVRRLHPARRRLAVRDQGRADPRRPAHPRRGPGRRGPGQPGAGDPAGPPGLGRPGRRGAGPARRAGAGRGRRPDVGRGGPRSRRWPARSCRRWRTRGWAADAMPPWSRVLGRRPRSTRWPPVLRVRRHRGRAPAGPYHRRDRRGPARPRRRLRPGRPVRFAAARAGQRAADRPQLLHRRPEGGARAGWRGETGQAMADLAAGALPADTGD